VRKPRHCIDVNSPLESKWNIQIPYKTAAIWSDNDVGQRAGKATIGMGKSPGQPWVLGMWLAEEMVIPSVAHELGHVMGKSKSCFITIMGGEKWLTDTAGMWHEQERNERNTYVRYDCTKLLDYHSAIARAHTDDPSLTTAGFCNDIQLAEKYSFSGRSYMQTLSISGKPGYTLTSDTPYDVNSIMHYTSYIMGNDRCQRGDQAQCPLGVYRDPYVHE
jgi:hypothetical protein